MYRAGGPPQDRGSGFGGPARGRGRGFGFSEPGFSERWTNRRIPPPPKTPCSDPLVMPFPKLRQRNASGTMTVDEELLRAIVSQFTVTSVASLPFMEIFEKLKRDLGHLTYLLYNDPDYLWAYIRCYPEHFAVDRDPRNPDYVWYLSRRKIVAKADRRRYEREFAAGNLEVDGLTPDEDTWNKIRYDDKLEQQALTIITAIFEQLKAKFISRGWTAPAYLPTNFLTKTLEQEALPPSLREYLGDEPEQFMNKRIHYFNLFGSQVSLRSTDYIDTIRSLTKKLKSQSSSVEELFKFLRQSPYLRQVGLRAISMNKDNFQFDDFLLFIHGHKFLFRLRPRDQMVELRHGCVPHIYDQEIAAVSEFATVKLVSSPNDLEGLFGDRDNEVHANPRNNFDNLSAEYDPKSPDFCHYATSAYTVRWLRENFEDAARLCDIPGEKIRKSKGRGRLEAEELFLPIPGFSHGGNSNESPGEGWPPLPSPKPRENQNRLASQSTSSFSSDQTKKPESESFNEWNGCF